ncbi:MAG TPA: ABC transporter ATP-binding protein [Actinopolymorphaceae bacterium]
MTVIEVNGLTKRYGDHLAVDDVSFTVDRGEIFGILGPNGAGKTTTVECIEGLRRPDAGTIRVLGLDPVTEARRLRERVGIQLQKSHLQEQLKVREALELYASFYQNPRNPRELLDQWGLTEKQDARFGKLSGGQQQRLFIALALIGRPEVAFLDELTTGLDPQARRATWSLIQQIRESGVTVVLVSHFMDEVEELCDRVAIFEQGRIVALDSPAGLVDQVDPEHSMRFRPVGDFDPGLLEALPNVVTVEQRRDRVVVTGRGDFATEVTAALARHQVVVADLRIAPRTLDDAYVALTGRSFDTA